MIIKPFLDLKRLFLLCFLVSSISPVLGQDISALSVPEIHKIAERLLNYSPDSAMTLLEIASQKTDQIRDYELATSYKAENDLRRADFWVLRDIDKSKQYLESATYYYKNHIDVKRLAEIYIMEGQLAKENGGWELEAITESLLYLDTAMNYALKAKADKLISFIYYEKARLLQGAKRWQESFEFAFLSIDQAEKSNDSLILTAAYYLTGAMYSHFGFKELSELDLSKSVIYGKGLASHSTIIHTYANELLKNGKLELALENYKKALSMIQGINHNERVISLFTKIGQVQLKSKMYDDALITLDSLQYLISSSSILSPRTSLFFAQTYSHFGDRAQAIQHLTEFSNSIDKVVLSEIGISLLKGAASLYNDLDLPKESILFYKMWGELNDSLRTHNSILQLADLERIYKIERDNNKEIEATNNKLQDSKSQQANMGILLILIILFGGIVIYLIRMKGLKENQQLKLSLKEKQLEQLIEAQEAERQRLGRELHDGIGQSLAALKMQIQLNNKSEANSRTVKSVDALCREVRTISHQMMPLVLEQNGLLDAIEQLVEQSLSNTDIEVDLVSNGFYGRLPSKIEVHLYRIAQELITNVLKHSNSDKVGLQLLKNKNSILLVVEDNGCGFDLNEQDNGIGLANINSRLEAILGNIHIQSSKKNGTYIRVEVPVSINAERKTA